MKRFEPTYGGDAELNRLQLNLQETIGFLKDVELLDGKLIEVSVESGETKIIPHGLGRKYRGHFPVKIRETIDGTVKSFDHFVEAASDDESLYFNLTILGSDELTLTFWIF